MSSAWSGTQERILEATRALFESEGPEAIRLEDVAAKAGVSRQAVYLNFGSRARLLVALVGFIDARAHVPQQAQRWRDAAQTPVERLDGFLAWWTGYLPRIRGVARALLAARATDKAAEAAWQNRMDALHESARSLVDALAAEGRLASAWDPAEAADWLWALISVQLHETLLERGWSHRRFSDRLRRVVHGALLAAETQPAPRPARGRKRAARGRSTR